MQYSVIFNDNNEIQDLGTFATREEAQQFIDMEVMEGLLSPDMLEELAHSGMSLVDHVVECSELLIKDGVYTITPC